MKEVKILGTGCATCKATVRLVEEVAQAKGVAIKLCKIDDLREIMAYNVMAMPGVVIDEKVVHAGGIPSRNEVASWF